MILSAPLAALAGNGANTPDPAAPNVAIPPIVVKAVATDFDINCRRESTPSSLSITSLLFDARSAVAFDDEDGAVVVNPSTDDANRNDENKRDEIFMID